MLVANTPFLLSTVPLQTNDTPPPSPKRRCKWWCLNIYAFRLNSLGGFGHYLRKDYDLAILSAITLNLGGIGGVFLDLCGIFMRPYPKLERLLREAHFFIACFLIPDYVDRYIYPNDHISMALGFMILCGHLPWYTWLTRPFIATFPPQVLLSLVYARYALTINPMSWLGV